MSRLANRVVKARTVCMTLVVIGCKGAPNKTERFRLDSNIICYAIGFEDFRLKCGKPGTEPEHMGMVGWRLFAPITRVSYIGVNSR